MKNVYTFILVILSIYNFKAQQVRSSYCLCETKGTEIVDKTDTKDVIINAKYSDGSITIKVLNNTPNTIYLFKSYFENDISISPYLYRYDKKKNEVNISFLPLLPYLFTKYSDKIIFQDRIIKNYQTVYDFYKILPFSEYTFSIITMDFKNSSEFIEDFDIYTLNKFQPIKKFKKKKVCKKEIPKVFVKVAYYSDINTICNPNAYFLDELKFNDAAKNFEISEIELK